MAEQKKEQTEYVVLIKIDDEVKTGNAWQMLGALFASSSGAAKRQALAIYRPDGGTVVAVPSRSWEPEDLKPKLSFG